MIRPIFRLKNQFIALCLLLMVLIAVIWATLYASMASILQNRARSQVDNMIAQVSDTLSGHSEITKFYANSIVNNQYTQRMLLEKDPYLNYFNVRAFRGTASALVEGGNLGSAMILSTKVVFLHINTISSPYSIVNRLDAKYRLFDPNARFTGYTGAIYDDHKSAGYYAYIRPIYDTGYAAPPQRKIGTLIIFHNLANLERTIRNFDLPEGYRFAALSAENTIIAGNDVGTQLDVDQAMSALSASEKQGETMAVRGVRGVESLIQYKNMPSIGWKLLSVVPISQINADLNRISRDITVFMLLVIGVIAVFYLMMYRSFVLPVRSIVKFTETAPKLRLSARISIKSRSEVGELAAHINRMLDRIDELAAQTIADRTRMYELELMKKHAELSALQSQINPHFLYNTLDCIKGFGHLYGSPEVVEIASSIAYIMRYAIKGDEFVPVKDELSCMQKYLAIISIRFGGRFHISIDIDPRLLEASMPRFIMQPILENAVYHGLEPRLQGGELSIRGYCQGKTMVFEVRDNGQGISEDKLAELQRALATQTNLFMEDGGGRGIGLLNIHNRLQTLYGPGFGVLVESGPGGGTTVRLKVAALEDAFSCQASAV